MWSYEEVLESSIEYFNGDQLAAEVFLGKYALANPEGNLLEKTPEDMHRRLAREFARIEKQYPNSMSEEEIFHLFDRFKFICVSKNTWITTAEGARKAIDLVGKPFIAVVDGQLYRSTKEGFFKTGTKQLFEIETHSGFKFEATAEHLVLVHEHTGWWLKQKKTKWVKVQDLKRGDSLVLNDHLNNWWPGKGTRKQGWLIGNLLGDGTFSSDNKASLVFQGKNKELEFDRALEILNQTVSIPKGSLKGTKNSLVSSVVSTGLSELANEFKIFKGQKKITKEIEEASSDFICGFLSGWFDADGTVSFSEKDKTVRLTSVSLSDLQSAQRMLSRLGIISTIYKFRKPAKQKIICGRMANCKDVHDLVISKKNVVSFKERINFTVCLDKQEKLNKMINSKKWNKEKFVAKVSSVTPTTVEDVYDCTIPGISAFDANGIYVHNCPQGSPMSGIGNKFQVQSLSNCFSLQPVADSYGGILKTDQELVQIAKRRGGIGFDISNLRPKGMITKNAAKTTDGISVFMERFSNSTREVAQCIAKGERVLTKKGLMNIENVQVGNQVWTKEGWIKVTSHFQNGKKKIFKLTTKAGYSIKTTQEHIFVTEKNNNLKEIKLKDFKIGNEVILLCGTEDFSLPSSPDFIPCNEYKNINNKPNNCNLPKQINEKLAYILGYSCGDGSVERNKKEEPRNLSLACSNDWEPITSQLFSYISDTFEYQPTLRKGDGNLKRLTINNKCVVNFLHENNILKQKTKEIFFPPNIFNNSTPNIFAFLSGYFDADGYASGSKKGYVFSSINSKFLKQIQTLLMSFGIPSKLYCEHRRKKKWNDLYSLCIVGSYAKTKFLKLMKKSIKVQVLQDCGKMDFWRTPYKAKTLNIKYNNYKYCNNSDYLSANTFNKLKQDGENLPELLLKDQVASIEEVGWEETYDLELESENLFWCEGFYVHNSGRRGALLLSISVHHPEIETFITIKNNLKKVTGANLSVRLSDEFMKAVKNKKDVELRWPVDSETPTISKIVPAEDIWNKICKSAYDFAEPGVLFWDTIIKNTPSDAYKEKGFGSVGVNPCSELILSSEDACRLLLINTTSFVDNPYTNKSKFDWNKFLEIANKAQRLMDDMVDLEIECLDKILAKIDKDQEPEEIKAVERNLWLKIKEKAIQGRRTGTGLTGIGDTLAALNIQYGSKKSIKTVEKIYKHLAMGCYNATIEMAKERKAFPIFEYALEKDHDYLQKIISSLEQNVQDDYVKYGRRNIALTTTAPAGSVSILTQTTSGIEPVFKLQYTRRKKAVENTLKEEISFVDDVGDKWQEFEVKHYGYQKWIDINKSKEDFDLKKSPYHGSTSAEIDWVAGVQLQAAAQKWIDHSISRTTNLPPNAILTDVKNIYMKAWQSKCKGLTVYREGSRLGVLVDKKNTTNNRKTLVENHAPKRPKSLPCDIYHITVDYNKWNAFVGLYEGKPFEIFAGLAKYVKIPKKYTKGRIEKHNGGNISTHYDLCFGDDPEDEMVIQDIDKIFENPTGAAFTRVVSLSLRHGTPVQYAVEQIVKGSDKESNLFSLNKAVARVLKNYIIDGTKPSQKKCDKCGSTDLAYEEGCVSCKACGGSKCS